MASSGTCSWFDAKKGFGFIQPDGDEEGAGLFVHHTGIAMDGFRKLCDGKTYVYDVVMDDAKGKPKAVNVKEKQ